MALRTTTKQLATDFKNENKPVLRKAKNIIHCCRSTDVDSRDLSKGFLTQELLLLMALLSLSKSSRQNGILGKNDFEKPRPPREKTTI
ncbi:hypothetical protein HNY73_022343 [Argiope bruennichi]|uniref:Uncharacterized protein n=1 Tax=Argiope bruennichi TaxID=94029 RepID=A0A8T0E468_ARGBR|nr:hypothetical protein HNY73_022343 [Argiope bruennichi]